MAIGASGVAAGLDRCLRLVRARVSWCELGMLPPGRSPLAGNLVVSREIELRGAFRLDGEFDGALELLAAEASFDGLVSAVVPCGGPSRRSRSRPIGVGRAKVLVDFGGSTAGVPGGFRFPRSRFPAPELTPTIT